MPEYRYTGVNVRGKPVQGILFSPDIKTVKNKIKEATKAKGVRIENIEQKHTFLYKVQRGSEKSIKGEQKSFNEDELRAALTKMGYKVFYVRRKLFDLKGGVPSKDLVLFIRICADLLREKFPYDEILTLVSTDTSNARLKETILEIQRDLKAGNEGPAVYAKHHKVLGKFTCHMLAVASTSGNMAEVYESTAKFLERDNEFRTKLRRVMVMPLVVTLAMIATLFFFILYIFPSMTEMLIKYDMAMPPMTAATMKVSDFLLAYWHVLTALIVSGVAGFLAWLNTERGRLSFDKFILNVPLLGSLMRKTSIEIFCRVFQALYSSSGENINAIKIASESCRNKYIEKQIISVVIPRMLKEGRSFVECLTRVNCFTLTAIRRLKAGEESGTLKQNAQQLANYYETENRHKMDGLIEAINLIVTVVITIMIIGLTLVSSEMGFVQPSSPLSNGSGF